MKPFDKCKLRPREYIKKGWGMKLKKANPPFIRKGAHLHDPEEDLVGEVFVYHTSNPTPFKNPYEGRNPQFKVETVKVLYIAQDKKLSLHFHREKIEIFYLVKGRLEITLVSDGQEEIFEIHEGDSLFLPACVVHQMKGLEEENILLEVSTEDSPQDSYRIQKGD